MHVGNVLGYGMNGTDLGNLIAHNGLPDDFDLELNYYSKFDKYWKEVERLINMSNSDLKQLWLDNRDVIVHNITNYCHMKWFGSYGNKFFRVQ